MAFMVIDTIYGVLIKDSETQECVAVEFEDLPQLVGDLKDALEHHNV